MNFVSCDAAVTVHPEQPSKLPFRPRNGFRLVIVSGQWFPPRTLLAFIFSTRRHQSLTLLDI